MNNIKKALVFAAASGAATFAMATPVVSDVTMTQNSGRKVTITYKLSEDAVVTLNVLTNATPNAATGWASIGGEAICNAQGAVWRKVTSADADGNGNYTITWHPDQSWKDEFGNGFKVADGCAKAVVTAWSLNNTPNYMVVDISATGGTDTQKYYPAADFVPGGVTSDHYKTATLLMRKIMAKDVTWTMGSVSESGRTSGREKPHQVTLANNYYIGVYPVTQTQWLLIEDYNPSRYTAEYSMRPVEMVGYTDIRQGHGSASAAASQTGGVYPATPYESSFLGKLRTKTSIDFDLPSDAQWEFAARAGHGEGYWGDGSPISISNNKDDNLNLLGRYLNNPSDNSSTSDDASRSPSVGGTSIVGTYAPNSWGLYDVYGNVNEWCLDYYVGDNSTLNGAVNTSGNEYTNRIKRGGSWSNKAGECRSAYRDADSANRRLSTIGFRVVCTAGLE